VEVEEDFVLQATEWKLKAFRVEHEPVDQAFGYRLDTDSASVALSGDTRYSENLVRHARNVDLLIHEVYSRVGMARGRENAATPQAQAIVDTIAGYHTPANDAGKVASQTQAKKLVLSQVILGVGGSPEDILADVATTHDGPATVASDLQVVTI
jgi:ribonuclease Z